MQEVRSVLGQEQVTVWEPERVSVLALRSVRE